MNYHTGDFFKKSIRLDYYLICNYTTVEGDYATGKTVFWTYSIDVVNFVAYRFGRVVSDRIRHQGKDCLGCCCASPRIISNN